MSGPSPTPAKRSATFAWEFLAAAATLALASVWSDQVTHDAQAVAQRVAQASCQLDALADALSPVRALSPAVDGEDQIADLRARLREHDWVALFPGRAVVLVPSVTGSGWNLVLEPRASAPCTTP